MPWLSLMNHTKLENKLKICSLDVRKEVLNKSLSESTLVKFLHVVENKLNIKKLLQLSLMKVLGAVFLLGWTLAGLWGSGLLHPLNVHHGLESDIHQRALFRGWQIEGAIIG